jgi:lipoprotein-anchoring transpeptidase ErfK/SrfK
MRLVLGAIVIAFISSKVGANPGASAIPSVDFRSTAPPAAEESRLEAIVNLPERILRVYRLMPGETIDDFTLPEYTFPVAIGTRRHPTPLIEGNVESKQAKPSWYAPNEPWAGELAGTIVPFGSRDNPFRARNQRGGVEGYFIALGQKGVGLHSTREARSIGKLASHGCIRMRLDDVRFLFRLLPLGTPVRTVYQLFRVSAYDTGVGIQSFDDVYDRFGPEERVAALAEHLGGHGIPIAMLEISEVNGLIAGENLEMGDFRLAAQRSPDAQDGALAVTIVNSENRVTEASEVLARAIASMPR